MNRFQKWAFWTCHEHGLAVETKANWVTVLTDAFGPVDCMSVEGVRAVCDRAGTPYRTELTPEGEQHVIPGCERNASPRAKQLDLF